MKAREFWLAKDDKPTCPYEVNDNPEGARDYHCAFGGEVVHVREVLPDDGMLEAALQLNNAQMEVQIRQVLEYCNGHTTEMWAATIVGILLKCDFREARERLREYLSEEK